MAKARERVTSGEVQDLTAAVEQLHEEIRLCRMAIDELRDDVIWAARQVLTTGYAATSPPTPLVPRDPLAPDSCPSQQNQIDVNATPADEIAESDAYCCARPRLVWLGDPDSPGIECANCGYLVAQSGEIAIWRDASQEHIEPTQAPLSPPQQKSLFDTE